MDKIAKRRLGLLGVGILSIGLIWGVAKGCGSSEPEPLPQALEKRLEKIEKIVTANQDYKAQLDYVLNNLHKHPEAADRLVCEGMEFLDRNGIPYSEEAREKIFNYFFVRAEKNPELVDFLGPNAQAYARKKWFKETTKDVAKGMYNAVKEGTKIITGGE